MNTNKCNCFDEMLNRYREKVKEAISQNATELEVDWEGYSYFFGGDYSPVNPRLNVSYRDAKRNGEPCTRKTKDQVRILCNFCPFCGRKLAKNEKAA